MPSPGDQWCSSGSPNVGAAVLAIIDATAILPPPFDVPGLFSLILSAVGVVSLATSDLCADPPRYPEDPSLQDIVDWSIWTNQPRLIQKYTQLAIYYAWPLYCTCNTYVPPAAVYPPPPVFPTTGPPLPTQSNPLDITCSFSALQSRLNGILALLNLIAARVGPQSYTLGNTHTVSGDGELSVSGIVGVICHALSYAPGVGYEVTDPPRFYDAGWIAFGDANGWYARQANIHDPQFHVQAPVDVTKVGFSCGMVTSMEITELIPAVIYRGN
jgi:hypothetical protein